MEGPPTLERYADPVMRRAFALWTTAGGLVTVALSALGALLLALFLTTGVLLEFVPETGLYGSAIAILWLLVLSLIVVPYQLWREEAERVRDLEARSAAKAVFRFGPDCLYNRATSNLVDAKARLIVRNQSTSEAVERLEVSVSRVSWKGKKKDVGRLLLSEDHGGSALTLNPGAEAVFQLAETRFDPRKTDPKESWVRIGPFARGNPVQLGQGEFRIKVRLTTKGAPAQEAICYLKFSVEGGLTFGPWEDFERSANTAESG